jgi:phosphatidate phosphatase LPIN
MNKFFAKVKEACDVNSSNLSGSIDVIVVSDESGKLNYGSFNLRISKAKMLQPRLKHVSIYVNDQLSKYSMNVNGEGIGYFEYFDASEEKTGSHYTTSNPRKDRYRNGGLSIFERDDRVYSIDSHNLKESRQTVSQMDSQHTQELFIEKRFSNTNLLHVNMINKIEFVLKTNSDVKLSICRHLISSHDPPEKIVKVFDQNSIEILPNFQNIENYLNDANLMIRINNTIYDSEKGIPQLLYFCMSEVEARNQEGLQAKRVSDAQEKIAFGKNMIKSLKPPADFFEFLQLNVGLNFLEYRFKGNFGKQYTIKSRLFYYPYQVQHRILISDIDGTITKSDFLGHIMPIVSLDWSHLGITELYSNLVQRGYIIIYLTARNIGLYKRTLKYLKNINQDGFRLPEGPLILSPDTLFESLKRELIVKNPEVFKRRVLDEISLLFCPLETYCPLFAGFGNKETDAIAYRNVGISKKRIFTINCEGEIVVLKTGIRLTYTHIHQNVNTVFPLFDKDAQPKLRKPILIEFAHLSNVMHK